MVDSLMWVRHGLTFYIMQIGTYEELPRPCGQDTVTYLVTSPSVTSAVCLGATQLDVQKSVVLTFTGSLASHMEVRHSRTFYIMLASTYEELPL